MGDKNKKSKWEQLSLSQKAGLIKIYVDNGFSDIDSIREDYNKNIENFQSNDANFVQRLRGNDTKYIQDDNGSMATHKLGYATDDNGAIIYPSVQEQNGALVDHSEDDMGSLESAIKQKDTVRTSIPFAEWYTQNYKKDYSKFFNRYNKFADGGNSGTTNKQIEDLVIKAANGVLKSKMLSDNQKDRLLEFAMRISGGNPDSEAINKASEYILSKYGIKALLKVLNTNDSVSNIIDKSIEESRYKVGDNYTGLAFSNDIWDNDYFLYNNADSNDFIDTYIRGDIPFENAGVIKIDDNDTNRLGRYSRYIEENYPNRDINTYQAYRDTLDNNLVKYLDKASTTLETSTFGANTDDDVYQSMFPFGTEDNRGFFDAAGYNIELMQGHDGKIYGRKSDMYDFLPSDFNDKWTENDKMHNIVENINNLGNPFIFRTPWFEATNENIPEEILLEYINRNKKSLGGELNSFNNKEFNQYNTFEDGGGIFSKLFKGKQKEKEQFPEEQTTKNTSIEEDTRGKYLPNNTREYFRYYKDYDDWYKRDYPKVQENLKEDALSSADYFFSKNPSYQSFYELVYGPYTEYANLRNKYEKDKKYNIPMGEITYRLKSIVNGKPTNKHTLAVHEDVLNYIYDEAIKAGVNPKTAIAIATQESNLGTLRAKDNNINLFDLFSYWRGTDSALYPNSKIYKPYNDLVNKYKRGEEFTKEDLETVQDLHKKYTTMVDTIHEYKGDSIVGDAVRLFDSGKYNLGDKNYINTVNSRFDELMNDKRFREWWNNKQKEYKE